MIAQNRYIVAYRDTKDARVAYYGPFVSLSVAEEFMFTLPEPQVGGLKTYKSLQPYSHDEATLARDVLLRKRTHGDLLDVIHNTF